MVADSARVGNGEKYFLAASSTVAAEGIGREGFFLAGGVASAGAAALAPALPCGCSPPPQASSGRAAIAATRTRVRGRETVEEA